MDMNQILQELQHLTFSTNEKTFLNHIAGNVVMSYMQKPVISSKQKNYLSSIYEKNKKRMLYYNISITEEQLDKIFYGFEFKEYVTKEFRNSCIWYDEYMYLHYKKNNKIDTELEYLRLSDPYFNVKKFGNVEDHVYITRLMVGNESKKKLQELFYYSKFVVDETTLNWLESKSDDAFDLWNRAIAPNIKNDKERMDKLIDLYHNPLKYNDINVIATLFDRVVYTKSSLKIKDFVMYDRFISDDDILQNNFIVNSSDVRTIKKLAGSTQKIIVTINFHEPHFLDYYSIDSIIGLLYNYSQKPYVSLENVSTSDMLKYGIVVVSD